MLHVYQLGYPVSTNILIFVMYQESESRKLRREFKESQGHEIHVIATPVLGVLPCVGAPCISSSKMITYSYLK